MRPPQPRNTLKSNERLERKHSIASWFVGYEMTNALAVFDLVVMWRSEIGVSLLIEW